MNELNAIAANIPFLPEWAKIVALNLFGVYIILQLLHLIIKKLLTPEFRTTVSALKSLSGEALYKASLALKLPVKRPRIALLAVALNSILYYVFALILFAWFGLFLMLAATAEDLSLTKRLLAFVVTACFALATRWYYASAERERIALIEGWKVIRGGK